MAHSTIYISKRNKIVAELATDIKTLGRVYDIHSTANRAHVRVKNMLVNGNPLKYPGIDVMGNELEFQQISIATKAAKISDPHDESLFKIGDTICSEWALIGARYEGLGNQTIEGGPFTPLELNRIKDADAFIKKYIELNPKVDDVSTDNNNPFDKEMLKSWLRFLVSMVNDPLNSILRFQTTDRNGNVIAQKNYNTSQRQELFRWICNQYDDQANVSFDYNVRESITPGNHKETDPIGKLARPTKGESNFVLHLPDGPQAFKVFKDGKFTAKDKVEWWPIPGVSVRTESEKIPVTFDKS